MKALTKPVDVSLWPKTVQCPHCEVTLEYTQDGVYLAREFELEGDGALGFWIDCINCTKSVQLNENHLPKGLTMYLMAHPRKVGAKDSVKIIGQDPRDLVDVWPKIVRCSKCQTPLEVDITDLRAGESFSPDGQYVGIEIYFICPTCSGYNVPEPRTLPADLKGSLRNGLIVEQKKTNRWKLLHGHGPTWEEEVRTKWSQLNEDQKWIMSGELYPMMEQRITVIRQTDFEEFAVGVQYHILKWLQEHPNAWPLI